jgi:hypothetical protein
MTGRKDKRKRAHPATASTVAAMSTPALSAQAVFPLHPGRNLT